jgi:hypothetical protein
MTSDRVLKALADAARHTAGEEPDAEVLAAAPLLEGWIITCISESRFVLEGVVTGHPRLTDGHLISTSYIVAIAHDDTWARTVSRYYRLGTPLFSRGWLN